MWDVVTGIASLATVVGIGLALFQLQISKHHRVREFEDMYVQRYWSIMDRLSADAISANLRGDQWLDSDSQLVPVEDLRAAYAYLLLCEDEIDLRSDGWISDRTWAFWRDGIISQLQRYPFAQAWATVLDSPNPASLKQLQELMKGGTSNRLENFDPCNFTRLQKYSRGLTTSRSPRSVGAIKALHR